MANWMQSRILAMSAAAVLVVPMVAGCGSGSSTNSQTGASLPPVDDTMSGSSYSQRAQTMPQPQQKRGMSTGTKVALLAGAAALYYMYKKNKEKRAQGDTSQPQYYLSKNGRVYYRDASGRAHWVTPPQQGIQVPLEEAYEYRQFQGYNGNMNGRTLENLPGYNYGSGYGY